MGRRAAWVKPRSGRPIGLGNAQYPVGLDLGQYGLLAGRPADVYALHQWLVAQAKMQRPGVLIETVDTAGLQPQLGVAAGVQANFRTDRIPV